MEEKELNQRLYDMFKEMLLVLENNKQGFLSESEALLTESGTRLNRILTSNLPFAEDLVRKARKDDVERKYLTLLPHLQLMAATIRNLIEQEKKRTASGVLFTEKAVNEIGGLHGLIQTQFQDATDYILTRNPRLKMNIKTGMERLSKMAEQYATDHEIRLITGVCMPKASYLYLAIVDCIKRLSMELATFSEEL